MSHRQQGRDGASASPHHSGQAQPLCPQRAFQDTPQPCHCRGRKVGPLASLMILMRTQLLVEEVISLKNSGAKER